MKLGWTPITSQTIHSPPNSRCKAPTFCQKRAKWLLSLVLGVVESFLLLVELGFELIESLDLASAMVTMVVPDIDRFGGPIRKRTTMCCSGDSRIRVDDVSSEAKSPSFLSQSLQLQDLDLTDEQRSSLEDARWKYHSHTTGPNQCTNILMRKIDSPLSFVWPIVRRFDSPQTYKRFVKGCVMNGDGKVGSLRDITVVSGLPASCSTERLEVLDDESHVLSFRVVGGEHRLRNYLSITSLHEYQVHGNPVTVVMESYVVDVPEGNTKEDTRVLTETIVKCNLQSLAKLCHRKQQQQQQKRKQLGMDLAA